MKELLFSPLSFLFDSEFPSNKFLKDTVTIYEMYKLHLWANQAELSKTNIELSEVRRKLANIFPSPSLSPSSSLSYTQIKVVVKKQSPSWHTKPSTQSPDEPSGEEQRKWEAQHLLKYCFRDPRVRSKVKKVGAFHSTNLFK